MKFIVSIFGLLPTALAVSRTSAPSGCITVAKSGGSYTTIQAAINSLSTTSTSAQCIFIAKGTYDEQVKVTARSAQLTIYGSTTDDTSYAANTVTITHDLSQADGLNNEGTATLGIRAAGFKLYNVNVENTYGEGSQAVALSSYVDSGFYGSSFVGFQDTVLSNEGNQVFVKSNGAESSGASYYVFNDCDIAAASGQSVPSGAYYLGRPWREYARVVFQYTSMSSVINSAGWHIWNSGDERTSNVLFGEYQNTGAGASGTRASFATKLSSAVSISTILGSGYSSAKYFDATYFASA
ncbi:hypothetical protein G7046_g3995 [Stylonectria norvegica]|nr:hypothetical protein G7046_g3995 [Stylonectria norvegica]